MTQKTEGRLHLSGAQRRWLMVIGAAVILALSLVLLFLLTQATDNVGNSTSATTNNSTF